MTAFSRWLSLLTAIVFGLTAKSQKIFFEQLTTAEGLPSDYVNCVFRDSKNFLWIATDKGVCRYDGRQFLYLNKDNGLPSNFVYCMAEDPEGNIWLGTLEGGLCKYNGREIITHHTAGKKEFKNIRNIYFNPDKSFFLASSTHLYYFSSETGTPEQIKDCEPFILPAGNNLFATGNGTTMYFIGKTAKGFSLTTSARNDFIQISNNQFLSKEGKNLLSYKTDGKTFILQKKFLIEKNLYPANPSDIKNVFINEEELFIATVSGLIYINDKGKELFLNSSHGLGSDYIRSIYNDARGNIYLCTFGSGIKIWPRLYLQEFKVDGKVTAIYPSGIHTYVTTTKNVYKHNPASSQFSEFTNIGGGNFTAAYKASSGSLYLGTLNNFYKLPKEEFLYTLNEKNKGKYAVEANAGTSGFLSANGRTYVSTYGDGIMEYDEKGNLGQHFSQDYTGSGIVEFLVPLKNSFAALTYSSGLTLFDKANSATRITTNENLLSNTVYSVFQEKEEEIWIGSLKGLNLFNGREVTKTFSVETGLIGSKVICIFRDAQKRLWVLSDKYLHLLEKDRLRAIRSHPILYESRNSINRAAYDPQNDLLYIGLTDALLTVDVKKIVPDTSIQQPGLAGILRDTTAIFHDKNGIVISPRSGKITFNFGHQFLSLSQKNDLYYKLAGFDEDWIQLDNSAEAVYQKLPAGNYELLAKTVNPDGYASGETKLLSLEVLPPLWQRTWFILVLSVLLLSGFFYIGHIISKKRYRQKLMRLQEEYRLQLERERIAMELHDNVGSQLTYLINKIDDDYPLLSDKNEAEKLSSFARGAMQELRETIWALDKKEIIIYDLDNKIMQLVALYNEEKTRVDYRWNNHTRNQLSVKSLQALNIYRIIQESLNNAVKYSGGERIYVAIEMNSTMMQIEVGDNGKGFNVQDTSLGYGLRNMKNRAAEMNARLQVKSEPGNGTIISLAVPLD